MDNTVGSQQSNVIVGTLLGDGCLERNGKYPRLVIDHSTQQKEYVFWKARCLKDFKISVVTKDRLDLRTRKVYSHCILRTHTTPHMEKYFDLFYYKKQKGIPQTLSKIINPQILAVWLMDDGYKRNDCNAIRLNTQAYSFSEQKIIRKSLQVLAIESTIQKHKSSYVVYIPSRSMSRMRNIVQSFIIPEMEYKIA